VIEDTHKKLRIGWREWIALPELSIPSIKVKIDTGARTSSLHTFKIEPFLGTQGKMKVRFGVHPLQERKDIELFCTADVIDKRIVKNSGGKEEERYVIKTKLQIKDRDWEIEITLSNRDNMKFRMLLGRTALRHKVIIDSSKSYNTGYSHKKKYLF
jgi:hypothetical protein